MKTYWKTENSKHVVVIWKSQRFWKTGENYYFSFAGPQHANQEDAMK